MDYTAEITAWQTGRADCMEREATHGHTSRWADEIQGYDDEATRLLELAAPLIEAVHQLGELDMDMWFHNATSFSCGEIDTIANLLTFIHDVDTAHQLLVEHAEGDDVGDDHWHLNPESLSDEGDQ